LIIPSDSLTISLHGAVDTENYKFPGMITDGGTSSIYEAVSPGYIAATTWATMLSFGEEGYVDETRRILDFTQKLTEAIKNIPGMVIPYDPKVSVITLNTDDDINASLVASLMKKKHWSLNIIKSGGFHFCVTALHDDS
jgi:hypothetical protein